MGAFYSAEDSTAMTSYPELPTFQTAGFTKMFMEGFWEYPGLSKKELDVKLPSGRVSADQMVSDERKF